jgi:LPS export ABC transporter protein LptC
MTPRRLARLLGSLGAAVLIAVLAVSVWIVHRRTVEEALLKAAGVLPNALLHARNFHWTQMKGDEKQWELAARDASFSNDKKSLKLVDAELSMVAKNGTSVLIRAPRADLTLHGNHVTYADLSGGIEAHYGDVVIRTERAFFLPDQDELDASGEVTIVGDGFKVTGTGLSARPHEQVFALRERVNTEFIPKHENAKQRRSRRL